MAKMKIYEFARSLQERYPDIKQQYRFEKIKK